MHGQLIASIIICFALIVVIIIAVIRIIAIVIITVMATAMIIIITACPFTSRTLLIPSLNPLAHTLVAEHGV